MKPQNIPVASHEYFVKLHKKIHWLLVYKEENFPALSDYFEYVLFQLCGLQALFPEDYRIAELIVLIKSAKIESERTNYSHKLYRKAILDAHGLLEELEESVVHE